MKQSGRIKAKNRPPARKRATGRINAALYAPRYASLTAPGKLGASLSNWQVSLDGSVSAEMVKQADQRVIRTALTRPRTNSRQKHVALYEFVRSLAELPEGHALSASKSAVDEALEVISLLTSYAADAPRVFTVAGDAVVLTWETPDVARYLTVSEDDLRLLDLRKRDRMKCVAEYPVGDDGKRDWLPIIGGAPMSESAVDDAS